MFLPETTISYKTYLNKSIVEGLRTVYGSHPDLLIRNTKVTLEFPNTKENYPTIVVRFLEGTVSNAGVGHAEFISSDPDEENSEVSTHIEFKHYFYKGNIEFRIYALSTLDRDLISDSLVQVLAMGDVLAYTRPFKIRVYSRTATPQSPWNFINLNTDILNSNGDSQLPAPWGPEDVQVFQTGYRIGVFGEFYSVPPDTTLQRIEAVNIYPYVEGDPVPTGVVDSAVWS